MWPLQDIDDKSTAAFKCFLKGEDKSFDLKESPKLIKMEMNSMCQGCNSILSSPGALLFNSGAQLINQYLLLNYCPFEICRYLITVGEFVDTAPVEVLLIYLCI
ncbi:UNVERIFIED_CONTAM: hypothetical protein K2H54_019165 [Gekko kuhli]